MTLSSSAWSTAVGRTRRIGSRYKDSQREHGRLVIAAQVLYCVVIGAALLITGNWPTPDQIGLALFAFALLSARPLAFLRDWSPFVLLILSYEFLRGFADGLVANTHIGFPITMDKAMFGGTLPTVFLQNHLWDPDHLRWYDYLSAFMHPMHFLVPLMVAFVFWMRSKTLYWKFVGSYLLLTYAGFLTYLLYPMAPPWYASQLGRTPPVTTILGDVLWQHTVSHPIVFVYDHFDANAVAAMPSLHAAFPILVFLVMWKLNPKWGWLTFLYPIVMDFAVVYMGEHYVTDVIAGTIYGAVSYFVVWELPDVLRAHNWWPRSRRSIAQLGGAAAGLLLCALLVVF